MAEENRDYRDDVFRDDLGLLVTWEWCTFLECYCSDTWVYTFDIVDGVGKKNIS